MYCLNHQKILDECFGYGAPLYARLKSAHHSEVGNSFENVMSEDFGKRLIRFFQNTGRSITADRSKDSKIQPEILLNYQVSKLVIHASKLHHPREPVYGIR